VRRRDAGKGRVSRGEGESEWVLVHQQTGHEQTVIGVRRALRHSVTVRNQEHKSKSIDETKLACGMV
jgi:hypothetical protein